MKLLCRLGVDIALSRPESSPVVDLLILRESLVQSESLLAVQVEPVLREEWDTRFEVQSHEKGTQASPTQPWKLLIEVLRLE